MIVLSTRTDVYVAGFEGIVTVTQYTLGCVMVVSYDRDEFCVSKYFMSQ